MEFLYLRKHIGYGTEKNSIRIDSSSNPDILR